MCFVLIDLLILLGAEWTDAATGYVLYAIALFILIVVLNVLRTPQDILEEMEKTQLVLYQQDAIKEYILSYQKYESELRTMHHDFKHLVASVNELAERNDLSSAEAIARDAEKWFKKQTSPEYSDNVLVNAVVEDYASRFAAKAIAFKASVELPPTVRISNLELIVILHNILSNAYEYCSRVSLTAEPAVTLKVAANRNYLYISCENPLYEPIRMKKGSILSTKSGDREKHGIGIESIRRTVKKYNGEMDISTENGRFVISLMVLNREPTEEGSNS